MKRLKPQIRFETLLDLHWDVFITRVGLADKVQLHKRILLEQGGRCNHCSRYEWMSAPIPTELEHKDGNHHNDCRDNLEVLCLNCHALTKTWRGRNKQIRRVSDAVLAEALKQEPSIRKALISVGLAGKGANYARCYKLMGCKH